MPEDRMPHFLKALNGAGWRYVPHVWNEELRRALSDNLVRVGWGGVLELTDAGRAALSKQRK